jgi:uncharacterized protein
VEKAVIGLHLCPFAESVYRGERVRFRVSEQRSAAALLEEFREELILLNSADPRQIETSLLIHPWALADFIEYNDFLGLCDSTIDDLQLGGVLQVASFHPHYQFAGTRAEDIENFTNRSPYPMLHLLRESSVESAIASVPDSHEIYRKNIGTLRALGHEGWQRLWRE